jgi:fumarylacetoacetase-like protein
MAPLACTVLLHLQDRVEQAQPHCHLGKEHAPRLTCGFPAVGADRACLRVGRERLGFLGNLAIALLQGPRIGRLDHAHPQETAPTDSRRDETCCFTTRVSFSSATRSRGTFCGSFWELGFPAIEIVDHRFADWRAFDANTLIADNALHGTWVTGTPCPTWRDLDFSTHGVRLLVNHTEMSEGTGGAVLGHPLNALARLANELP